MRKQVHLLMRALAAAALAASATAAIAGGSDDEGNFCMDVDLGPFHMVPGFMTRSEAVDRYGEISGRDVSKVDFTLLRALAETCPHFAFSVRG